MTKPMFSNSSTQLLWPSNIWGP